jgi:Bacterial Ig domain/Secretion system C-terminal sorting domain
MQAFLRLILLSGSIFFCISNTKAQSNCNWQQGVLETYSQGGWDEPSPGFTLLTANFITIPEINGYFQIGTNGSFTISFTTAGAIAGFLQQNGVNGTLINSMENPTDSYAGALAGDVLALTLNVIFSQHNLLGDGTVHLGDLIIVNVDPLVDGMTVNEFLSLADSVLSGISTTITPDGADNLASIINNAFINSTPSQFAIDNLLNPNCNPTPSCDWQQGDLVSHTQFGWDTNSDWFTDYNSVYAPTFGVVEVGTPDAAGYSLQFTSPTHITEYFVAVGSPAVLVTDLVDPTTTSTGNFGGEVLALQLNVDFSDSDKLGGTLSVPFGDLVMYNMDNSALNGMTIRQLLSIANVLLGGGSNGYDINEIVSVLMEVNGGFNGGTPSQWAQDHLRIGWQQGDICTYTQNNWETDGATLLTDHYDAVFDNTFGAITIGEGFGYNVTFTSLTNVLEFLPQAGVPSVFDASLTNPTSTNAHSFGGEAVALTLNVNFSGAGYLGTSSHKLGDLTLSGFNSGDVLGESLTQQQADAINGKTISQVLAEINLVISGGTGTFGLSVLQLYVLALELNASFYNCTPDEFAQVHLFPPCISVTVNHCPFTTSSSVTIPQGTSVNIELQATDEDNDALTYSIRQNPSHGTVSVSATGLATYTPTAGYSGTDQFKFKASDGKCDAEGTVNISIVVCPKLKGYWKNNPNAWPASATPMLLGTQSYTKNQLLVILNTPVGTGPKADASLILAQQLIAAKLNVANGTQAPASVTGYISSADALIGGNTIPMKVKPSTALGKMMTAVASSLESFNNGALSTGCPVSRVIVPAVTQKNITSEEVMEVAKELEVKATPNPANNYFNVYVRSNNVKDKITMQVIDMYGRVIEVRNVAAEQTIRLGDNYRPGTYFVKFIQATEHKEIKLIKLPN